MYDQYIELIWFFIGVFVYRTISSILSYSHLTLALQGINKQILKLLGTVAEDVGFIRSLKYRYMADSGMTDEQINEIKEVDGRSFFMWKNSCISHILLNCPKGFKSHLKYHDWKSALNELDRLYEVEGRKKKS
tara:strand:- start:157 stop:555 length:399 start_codon:yes stop_codon:yes gene_type:complete